MPRLFKISVALIFFVVPFAANSHVQHYKNLGGIEFDIYRNSNHIGSHIFSFEKSGDQLFVRSEIKFSIKKFGITLYKYYAEGTEVYNENQLVKFISTTNQNGKNKYVNMIFNNDKYHIDGSSYKGDAPKHYLIGTWWNHSMVDAEAQISAVSGRIIKQKVKFLGKEKVKIGVNYYNTLRYNFSSVDKKLNKNKKLNTDVWYDEKTLNWVKASFNKKGKWEYKLKSIW
jgi:hypothetical protein